MLTFTCNTCLKIREVVCLDGKATYMIENKRYIIKDENQDCNDCFERLRADDNLKREQIRMESIGT